MPRRQQDPLRPRTADERRGRERIARAHTEPSAEGARATALRAGADGQRQRCTDVARVADRRRGAAVAHLVARLGRAGLAALPPALVGARPPAPPRPSRSASSAQPGGHRIAIRMGRPRGR